ncbi:hypothetical protein [Sediminibacillus massiliensis]|uniref:hypothetical protein n=1 Tax=Sediminibacillus massiliensis TaxID=1926277 RepID=UPI0009883A63|nr:hypothetical protein [Sediminibacillus massiliensis]
MDEVPYIIGALIGSHIGIVLLCRKRRKRKVNFRSIFPDPFEDWTTRVAEIDLLEKSRQGQKRNRFSGRRNTYRSHSSGMYSSNDYTSYDDDFDFHHQDDHNWDNPYENPGTDLVVDEVYHGRDV